MEPTAFHTPADHRLCAARAGDADVALLGEMSHGTADFYEARADLSLALAEDGFRVIGLEADWPDAAAVDAYVRHRTGALDAWRAYARWPTWMWRNTSFLSFVERLRRWNEGRAPDDQVSIAGLDLYSMSESISAVLAYLQKHRPELAKDAARRYGCLARWQEDPARYGAAFYQGLEDCREAVVQVLARMLQERLDGIALFDAQQNARTVAGAEAYYRALYDAKVSSWDLRDTHMADTLDAVRHARSDARVAVWAHNSHVGDARGMLDGHGTTLGTLCRQRHRTWSLGAFTYRGTVTAGHDWDAPAEKMEVMPSRDDSHGRWLEGLGHERMVLHVGDLDLPTRLERAIGVVYRPQTERMSHYFPSRLQKRYDDVLWLRTTRATEPLPTHRVAGTPETWPSSV